jgi:Cu/Ag efflux protein CusF
MTRFVVTLIAFLALLIPASAQQKGKGHKFTGKVTEVGKDAVTVNHGDIPGFMGPMTMPYKVDKVDILSKVKAGDQIEATVYENDYTLYEVKVVPAAAKAPEKAKK